MIRPHNNYYITKLIDKLVLKTQADFGFLGAYNQDRGNIPFERFFLGENITIDPSPPLFINYSCLLRQIIINN